LLQTSQSEATDGNVSDQISQVTEELCVAKDTITTLETERTVAKQEHDKEVTVSIGRDALTT